METSNRKCKKCGDEKPLAEFPKHDKGGHRHECKECQRNRIRGWEARNADKKKVNAKASYDRLRADPEWRERRNAQKRVSSGNNYAARTRDEVIAAYGGPICACCGETEPKFLTIDHINNDGHLHRKQGNGATNLYNHLKARKFPPGFQVLCMNCNFGKARNGGICPHKSRQEGSETIAQASTLK